MIRFFLYFAVITIERVYSYSRAVSQRHMIWRDLISTAVQTFLAGAVMGAIVLPVLHYFPNTFLGRRFLFGLSNQLGPLWVQVLAVFSCPVFSHYWVHRFEHYNEFLWKLHGYHHSVTHIQISNVLVSNPFEWALRNILGGLVAQHRRLQPDCDRYRAAALSYIWRFFSLRRRYERRVVELFLQHPGSASLASRRRVS